jgi:hypothetical protein
MFSPFQLQVECFAWKHYFLNHAISFRKRKRKSASELCPRFAAQKTGTEKKFRQSFPGKNPHGIQIFGKFIQYKTSIKRIKVLNVYIIKALGENEVFQCCH